MTLTAKIGQMLCFGWSDDTPGDCISLNSHAQTLIAEFQVGSVILMGRNIGPPETLRALLSEFQSRAQAHNLPPLLIATDQEGGRVSRLAPPYYAARPTSGEIASEDAARQNAELIGRELKSLGFNWDFAPVLDVNNNPKNPVIGTRSFGDDPAHVARLGAAAVRGFHAAGVLACGKHFPGHGDTDTDSHFGLPRIAHNRQRLEDIELVPFRAAIDAGLRAIMTAHILFPAIDPALPATLSPAILTGMLREELGFDGLIITDDLEMRGVADKWGAAEAAVLAVLAGADIVLCCHTLQTQHAIRNALQDAVQTKRISETRIDESLTRIADAKTRWAGGV